jgi:hypothetical protein
MVNSWTDHLSERIAAAADPPTKRASKVIPGVRGRSNPRAIMAFQMKCSVAGLLR